MNKIKNFFRNNWEGILILGGFFLMIGALVFTIARADFNHNLKDEAPLTDQELVYVREMINELYVNNDIQDVDLPSLHHIEDTIKHWVENDITNQIKSDFEKGLSDVENTLGTQEGVLADVKDDVSTIRSEVNTFSDQIEEQVNIAISKGIEPELEKVIEPVLGEAFKIFVGEFKPILKDFITEFEDVFPDNASLRVGCLEVQWNDITSTQLNNMKVALDKTTDDFESLLDALGSEVFVGIDCSADLPILGEKSVGVELEAYWSLDDFKQWFSDNRHLFENL